MRCSGLTRRDRCHPWIFERAVTAPSNLFGDYFPIFFFLMVLEINPRVEWIPGMRSITYSNFSSLKQFSCFCISTNTSPGGVTQPKDAIALAVNNKIHSILSVQPSSLVFLGTLASSISPDSQSQMSI